MAVLSAVLTHRGNEDSVLESETPESEGCEQQWVWFGVIFVGYRCPGWDALGGGKVRDLVI